MNRTALILLHPGFEELEACAPIDLLRRSQIQVTTASTAPHRRITGRSNITIEADTVFETVSNSAFDCLVIPGGPGIQQNLRADSRVKKKILQLSQAGALICAICAAPLMLRDLGLLTNRRYTAHPSTYEELQESTGQITEEDANIITSRGAGTATEFALAIIQRMQGKEMALGIAESIGFIDSSRIPDNTPPPSISKRV